MTVPILDFETQNDSDYIRSFLYRWVDGGPPIDISGNTLRMGIRRRAEDVAEELLLTTETGEFIITDGPGGAFTMAITMDKLLDLPVGDYVHSMVMLLPTGEHRLMWTGTLTNAAGPSRIGTQPPMITTIGMSTALARRQRR
jgi:hypothetical protein